jgi:DNA-3-methyladenine glycosylase
VARARALTRRFFDRDALDVAPELLNKVLAGNGVSARLVEVEAYRADEDPGSHAFRGRTPRNASMFAAPGALYVYFSYGNHWCMNAVCGPGERAHAVLLRAAAPLSGIDVMRARRPAAARDRDLMSGPGKLGQAFDATRELDGTSLLRGPLRIPACRRVSASHPARATRSRTASTSPATPTSAAPPEPDPPNSCQQFADFSVAPTASAAICWQGIGSVDGRLPPCRV